MATVIRYLLHGTRRSRPSVPSKQSASARLRLARARRRRASEPWRTRSTWERVTREPSYHSWVQPFGGSQF